VSYLDELGAELARVGIRGRLRARILAEAADHLAQSEPERFGDPRAIARLHANALATDRSRHAAAASFAALAAAGLGLAAAWLLTASAGGWPDIASADLVPLGISAAFGMLLCPQLALAAGLLMALGAWQGRQEKLLPASEVALLVRRTRTALACGALSLGSVSLYAIEFRAGLASWYVVLVPLASAALTIPLVAAAGATRRAAAVVSSAPGEARDVFERLPWRLSRRPWVLCLGFALLVGAAALAAGGADEGPRNAAAEVTLVVVGFAVLGRRLGLRGR
jgi:hypothetical protein